MSNSIEKLFDNIQRHREKFLEKRQVFLWGPVHDESAERVTNDLLYLEMLSPGTPVTFFINSPGGVVTSGMVVYDTMKMISSPVYTVCMGLAASMGSLLLSGGEKGHRTIFPSGRVMIHQPSIGGHGMYGSSDDLQIQAKEIQRTKELGAKVLADNCGKSVEQVMQDFDRDKWMNAGESVEYGIVDSIQDKIKI